MCPIEFRPSRAGTDDCLNTSSVNVIGICVCSPVLRVEGLGCTLPRDVGLSVTIPCYTCDKLVIAPVSGMIPSTLCCISLGSCMLPFIADQTAHDVQASREVDVD
eukprot:1675161-Amphidinium_carterae.1